MHECICCFIQNSVKIFSKSYNIISTFISISKCFHFSIFYWNVWNDFYLKNQKEKKNLIWIMWFLWKITSDFVSVKNLFFVFGEEFFWHYAYFFYYLLIQNCVLHIIFGFPVCFKKCLEIWLVYSFNWFQLKLIAPWAKFA